MHLNPFTPGETVTRSTSTSTANIALGKPLPAAGASRVVRVALPAGSDIVFIAFGGAAVTAAAASGVPILPGTTELFEIGASVTHIAAIAAANTPTIYATTGFGS